MNKDISIVDNNIYIVKKEPFEVDASILEAANNIFVPEDYYNLYIEADTFKDYKDKIFRKNYGNIAVNKPDFVAYVKSDELFKYIYKNGGCESSEYMTLGEYQNNFITFEDANVKSVIVSKFGTDGEITYEQASKVTNQQLEGLFNQNKNITKFNEFVFFTGITQIGLENDTNKAKNTAPFRLCSNLTEITLPPSIKILGVRAFDDSMKLRKVKNIGKVRAFRFCCLQHVGYQQPNYKPTDEVIIVDEGGVNAFGFCPLPKKVIVTEKVKDIPLRLFLLGAENADRNYESISLPSTIKTIGDLVFQYCPIKHITLPEGLESIGASAFIQSELTSIDLPDSIKSIGNFAFKTTKLKGTLNLPCNPQYTTVNYQCFRSCLIDTLIIPKYIRTIGDYSFDGCSRLKDIYIRTSVPPTLSASAFTGCPIEHIYIPKEYINAYKTAANWSTFANKMIGI